MTDATPESPPPEVTRLRIDVRAVALVGLFILMVLFTLRLARQLLVPIAVALLLDFLLSPIVRLLRRFRIREWVSAAVLVFGLVTVAGAAVYVLAGPAARWVERAPSSIRVAQSRVRQLFRPLERIQEASEAVEEATRPNGKRTGEVELAAPSLFDRVTGGTVSFISTAATVIFLLYFLLASGDLFMQKLVGVLPLLSDKKKAVGISREIESHISRYLSAITVINIGLGIATAVALGILGMPNAALWGAIAGVMNFVPYLGLLAATILIGLAALVSFENPGQALLMPGVYLGLNLLETNLITPLVLGRQLPLNHVALFVGLLVWWFLWGIPGAILAVPMLVAIKIFCDHIETLKPVGTFLGP